MLWDALGTLWDAPGGSKTLWGRSGMPGDALGMLWDALGEDFLKIFNIGRPEAFGHEVKGIKNLNEYQASLATPWCLIV